MAGKEEPEPCSKTISLWIGDSGLCSRESTSEGAHFPGEGDRGTSTEVEGPQPQHSHCCNRGWEDATLAHKGDLGIGAAPSRADLGDTRAFSREPRAFVNRSSNKHLSFHRWCSQFTAGTFKGRLGHTGAHGHKQDTRNTPGLQASTFALQGASHRHPQE